MVILINGKKVGRKMAAKKIGQELLDQRIKDTIYSYVKDSTVRWTWQDGMVIYY